MNNAVKQLKVLKIASGTASFFDAISRASSLILLILIFKTALKTLFAFKNVLSKQAFI